MDNIRYKYQQKDDFVSIRDKFENGSLEIERKGDSVSIVTYSRNEKVTKFTLPINIFKKLYVDISKDIEQ